MSAANLVVRMVIFPVALLVLAVIFVFGFTIIEPFYQGFGEPPESLGWGTPGLTVLRFGVFGMLGMVLVLIIWFVYAPIRQDRRQQFR